MNKPIIVVTEDGPGKAIVKMSPPKGISEGERNSRVFTAIMLIIAAYSAAVEVDAEEILEELACAIREYNPSAEQEKPH